MSFYKPFEALTTFQFPQRELEKLGNQLDGEKMRQEQSLKEQIAKRKQQRIEEMKKRQELKRR